MSENPVELKARLEALGREIEDARRTFAARGVLSDAHAALIDKLARRRADAAAKVDDALRSGSNWRALEAEFARDYGGVWEEWARLIEAMDGAANKGA